MRICLTVNDQGLLNLVIVIRPGTGKPCCIGVRLVMYDCVRQKALQLVVINIIDNAHNLNPLTAFVSAAKRCGLYRLTVFYYAKSMPNYQESILKLIKITHFI